MQTKAILFVAGLMFLAACNDSGIMRSSPAARGSSLTDLTVSSENWGGDITIAIAQSEQLAKGMTRYTLLSKYGEKTVGFYLDLFEPKGKSMFVGRGVVLRSMGDTSNNFLAALGQIYGVRRARYVFADSVVATYAVLETEETKEPGNWAAAQKKLFFGDGSVELFMNVNAGSIGFPEKDSANRGDIVDALSRGEKK